MVPYLSRLIFTIEVWHFIALILILTVNTLLYRYAEKSVLLYRYLALQTALLVWVVSKILKTVSPDITLRWSFIVTQYMGISALGPLFFSFAWQYIFRRSPPAVLKYLLILFSLSFSLAVLTNPLHYLFYATFAFHGDSFGPLFYLFQGVSYALTISGILLISAAILYRRRTLWDILIIAAALLPLGGNIAYIFDLMETMFDYTPLFMTGSLFFFGLAVFRSYFLGIVPVARSILLTHLTDPIILTNRKGRILGQTGISGHVEVRSRITRNNRKFKLYHSRKTLQGTLHHYIDITNMEELQTNLAKQNSNLSESLKILKSRYNEEAVRIRRDIIRHSRRELHDILGHSLTQVIYLLRRILENDSGKPQLIPQLEQCGSLIIRSIDELKNTLKGKVRNLSILSIALRETVDNFILEQTRIELTVRGRERSLTPEIVASLLRCCQEGITNAVKHGQASRIDIALLYGEEKIALIIADNGKGFNHKNRGSGLSLMQTSVEQNDGVLRIWSAVDDGCQITIRLPYPATAATAPSSLPEPAMT